MIFEDIVGVEEEDVVDFLRELSRGLRFVLLEFDEEVGDVGDVGCMAGDFGALPAVPCFVVLLFMFTLGVYCVD